MDTRDIRNDIDLLREENKNLKADLLAIAKDVRSILNQDNTARGQEETMFVVDRLIRALKAEKIIKDNN